jgi:hypothetical protein
METMSRWTDARLDDLNERVADVGRRMDSGFDRVESELRELRAEMGAEIGSLRSEMRSEIAALHRLVLQVAGGMFATFAIGFAGMIATQL